MAYLSPKCIQEDLNSKGNQFAGRNLVKEYGIMVIILFKMIVLTNVRADNSSQVIQVTFCSRNS